MPNFTDIRYDSQFVLMKGEPGTRKSTAALSYPGPQYWFSYDMKMESLGIPMRNWGIDPTTIDYDDYHDWFSAETKLKKFRVECNYKTIIIDSVTTLGDSINRQTLAEKYGSSNSAKGKKIGGIAVNSIEDFNAEASAFQELIALLKDIQGYNKLNVIVIAHVLQTEFKTIEGKTHMSRTLVTGGRKVAAKLPAYFPEIYHFNKRGGDYGVLTSHSGDDFARTALPLKEEIMFGDQPLYEKYITPAIKEASKPIAVTARF